MARRFSSAESASESSTRMSEIEELAVDYNMTVEEIRKLKKVWPFLKGLSEWRRDDPSSHPTDPAELIKNLKNYHPELRLSVEKDGFMAQFVEEQFDDVEFEDLVDIYKSWISENKFGQSKTMYGSSVSPRSDSNAQDQSGMDILRGIYQSAQGLVQVTKNLDGAARRGAMPKVQSESVRLNASIGMMLEQIEEAVKVLHQEKNEQKSEANSPNIVSKLQNQIKAEAAKAEEKYGMLMDSMQEGEKTISQLQEQVVQLKHESQEKGNHLLEAEAKNLKLTKQFEKYKHSSEDDGESKEKMIRNHERQVAGLKIYYIISKKQLETKVKVLQNTQDEELHELDKFKEMVTERDAEVKKLRTESEDLAKQNQERLTKIEMLEQNVSELKTTNDELAKLKTAEPIEEEFEMANLENELDGMISEEEPPTPLTTVSEKMDRVKEELLFEIEDIIEGKRPASIDEELGEWLYELLIANGWKSKKEWRVISEKLGITYSAVRKARRRPAKTIIDMDELIRQDNVVREPSHVGLYGEGLKKLERKSKGTTSIRHSRKSDRLKLSKSESGSGSSVSDRSTRAPRTRRTEDQTFGTVSQAPTSMRTSGVSQNLPGAAQLERERQIKFNNLAERRLAALVDKQEQESGGPPLAMY